MDIIFAAPIPLTPDTPIQVPDGAPQRPALNIALPKFNPPLQKRAHGVDVKPKNSWESCIEFANRYVGDVGLWKDEIDKLLIFAGLFSAVVASFAVESYHALQQDPADTTVLLLKSLLVLQLNATNPQPNLPIDLDPQVPISSAAKRIGIYNFLSLILSLSVVMGGILCLQWIREYSRSHVGSQREQLGAYYMRHEGLEKWHVFKILTMLPFILLLSLLLFFAGLIELLVEVDVTCAIISAVFIGIASLFLLITTLLPTVQAFFIRRFYSQCPYKSPQALIFYHLIKFIINLSTCWTRKQNNTSGADIGALKLRDWLDYDLRVYSYLKHSGVLGIGWGLHWLGRIYMQSEGLAKALYESIQDASTHNELRDILSKVDTPRYDTIVRSSTLLSSRENQDQLKNKLTVFQTLAHLADKTEQGRHSTALLEERVKLFLEIHKLVDPAFDQPHTAVRLSWLQNVDCPLASSYDWENKFLNDAREAVVCCILRMLKAGVACNRSHLSAVEGIVGSTSHLDLEDIQKTMEDLETTTINPEFKRAVRNVISHIENILTFKNHPGQAL
ncbi:hypothetical protein D9756_002954 [Leucocoprinus leucothites]|uniref:DUF6535 domain-containing protein n=1 Tax=Leucocoprinus leucothites TaxID=201217 RepID=A0A8H5G7U1_9AGAR|nr:hypothetical protein D9756_002954 [Leucoagaricus leucothites]